MAQHQRSGLSVAASEPIGRTLSTIVTVAVLAGILGTSGCGLVEGGGQLPRLSPSSSTVSFGSVTVGSPASQSVVVKDSGTRDITISGLAVTGPGFTMTGGSPATLTPGQSITISLSFTPQSAGSAQGMLSVLSDAANSPMDIALSGSGVSKPSSQLQSNVSSINFGNLAVGSSASQPVVLTDAGNSDITISGVTASGSGFILATGSTATLAPNESVTVTVDFKPSQVGSVSGTLAISSNASNAVLSIPLSGNAVAAPSSQLQSNVSSINFGSVNVGTPVTKSVVLVDSGTANVTISAVSATGSGFSASGGSNLVLTPNGSVTISVSFDPSVVAADQGNLSISSNASNSVLDIPLSGTGTSAPAPPATPASTQHSVLLNWQASPSQVVGYFVYRGSSSTSLSKLFLSSISETNFTDNSVSDGDTYFYEVTAVDSNNVESSPSNEVSVTIPSQ